MFPRRTHRNRPQIATALATACSILLLTFSPQFAAHAAPPAVTNCNTTGPGSLRAAIAGADSGDTIKAYLACTVHLQSTLTIHQDSLTIEGLQVMTVDEGPVTRISGGDQHRVFEHTGTGTLRLRWLTMTDGNVTTPSAADGGCIRSAGNVSLYETWIRACTASSQAAARGGGVYAQGNVTLSSNTRVANNHADSLYSIAEGGGIYVGGTLLASVESNVHVENNSARTGSDGGDTHGGGIYADLLWAAGLTVANNRVSSLNTEAYLRGGGIYAVNGMLNQVHIVANDASDENYRASGGGIYVKETFALTNSTVVDNTAHSGGGISSGLSGSLSVGNSTVDGNHASDKFGGIFAGDLVLENSSVSGNHAEGSVGGLHARHKATIRRSTIAGNTAAMHVGASFGITPVNPDAIFDFLVEQSTISGNLSADSGLPPIAGLYAAQHLVVRNSTITENRGHKLGTLGGIGIFMESGAQLELYSTVVSDNAAFEGCGNPPCHSNISRADASVTGNNNLIGTSLAVLPPDTIHEDDPGLGPLGNHGGSTLTHVPRPGSPLINKGLSNGFTTDQRGAARVWGAAADIGSVERHPEDDIIFRDGFEGID